MPHICLIQNFSISCFRTKVFLHSNFPFKMVHMVQPQTRQQDDFVLKLFVAPPTTSTEEDENQQEFRRVKASQVGIFSGLPKSDAEGFVVVEAPTNPNASPDSYRALVAKAMTFFVPTREEKQNDNGHDLQAQLMYIDEDGDYVMIDSTGELLDAVATAVEHDISSLKIAVRFLAAQKQQAKASKKKLGEASYSQEKRKSYEDDGLDRHLKDLQKPAKRTLKIFAAESLLALFVSFWVVSKMCLQNENKGHQETIDLFNRNNMDSTQSNTSYQLHLSRDETAFGTFQSTTKASQRSTEIHNDTLPRDDQVPSVYLLEHLFAPLIKSEEVSSPLMKAYEWILKDRHWKRYPRARLLQRFALAAFFHATDGPNWKHRDYWLDYRIHECHWWPGSYNMSLCGKSKYLHGQDWNYERLWLPRNGLKGSLPPQIFQWLPLLRVIRLDSNALHGPLPSEIGLLANLEQIWLHWNRLSSSIPSDLSKAANLQNLCLARNELTGTVPSGLLSKLFSLQKLCFGYSLTDDTPVENWSKKELVIKVHLQGNNFSNAPGLISAEELSRV